MIDSIFRPGVKPVAMSIQIGRNHHGNLRLRIYWRTMEWNERGESTEGIAMKDTPENRAKLQPRIDLINREMAAGKFDYLAYFPNGNKADYFRAEKLNAIPYTVKAYGCTDPENEVWLKDKRAPFVKKTLARGYRSHLNARILTNIIAEKRLSEVTFADIKAFRSELGDCVERGEITLKTAKNVINGTLRAMFRDAKAEGLITKNPFDEVPARWWPRTVTPPPDPFSEDERDQILAFFKAQTKFPERYAFVCALFWSGRRPSEITPRRWRDYDARTAKLTIASSLTEGEEGATKTRGSETTIDLLPPIVEAFERCRPLHPQPDEFILINKTLGPINHKQFAARHFWPALDKLKIRHRDFYSTRDTFISVMLKYGYHPKQIADVCGNSPETIFKNYAKWLNDPADQFGTRALGGSAKKAVSHE